MTKLDNSARAFHTCISKVNYDGTLTESHSDSHTGRKSLIKYDLNSHTDCFKPDAFNLACSDKPVLLLTQTAE
jgi:hypothetical protein